MGQTTARRTHPDRPPAARAHPPGARRARSHPVPLRARASAAAHRGGGGVRPLSVAENPAEPAWRRIGLHVARVPRSAAASLPIPCSCSPAVPGRPRAISTPRCRGLRAHQPRSRHRARRPARHGALEPARSAPRTEDTPVPGLSDAQIAGETRDCLAAGLPARTPALYTTSIAVQDLEQVRRALGYGRIDLYGVSYGTRVAQQYLRRYPATVRAVILDGVLPPTLAMGPQVASMRSAHCAALRALRQPRPPAKRAFRIRRRTTPPCAPRWRGGAPVRTARTRRRAGLRHSSSAADQLAMVLRLASYSSDYSALLPLLLHAARRKRGLRAARRTVPALRAGLRGTWPPACTTAWCAPRTCPSTTRTRSTARRWRNLHGCHPGRRTGSRLQCLAARACGCGLARAAAQQRAGAAALGQRRPGDPARVRRAGRDGLHAALQIVLAGFAHGQLTAPAWAACWRSSSKRKRGGAGHQLHRPGPADAVLPHAQRAGAMIEAAQLTKHFGSVAAVRDVSLVAQDGRITGLLGPNGAGKSTTLRMLYTVLRPDGGDALIDGHSAVHAPAGGRAPPGGAHPRRGHLPEPHRAREHPVLRRATWSAHARGRARAPAELIRCWRCRSSPIAAPRGSRRASA